MESNIQNIQELRERINFLKLKKAEDEIYFHQKYEHFKETITSPFRFIKNSLSFINPLNKSNPTHSTDWVTNMGRILVPFLLNKTLLRNRGFFIKTIASLISQKTINADILNKNVVASWIDKATSWINSTIEKKNKPERSPYDFGVPPESETY